MTEQDTFNALKRIPVRDMEMKIMTMFGQIGGIFVGDYNEELPSIDEEQGTHTYDRFRALCEQNYWTPEEFSEAIYRIYDVQD